MRFDLFAANGIDFEAHRVSIAQESCVLHCHVERASNRFHAIGWHVRRHYERASEELMAEYQFQGCLVFGTVYVIKDIGHIRYLRVAPVGNLHHQIEVLARRPCGSLKLEAVPTPSGDAVELAA